MRVSTANNHLDAIRNQLDSQFRSAIFYRPSLKDVLDNLTRVCLDYPAWEILPRWVKDELSQHRTTLLERIYREHTIQLYVLRNGGKVVSRHAWDNFDENTRQFIRDGGKLPIKTFWLQVEESCAKDGTVTRISRPTDDVYFESES